MRRLGRLFRDSANPAIGHASDLLAALGARTILSEFPELCGVEQEFDQSRGKQRSGRSFHRVDARLCWRERVRCALPSR